MALTDEDLADLQKARVARRTEEFLTAYRAKVEKSRLYHEALARRQEPTDAQMSKPFTF